MIAVFQIIDLLLTIVTWIIVIQAIMSWLIAFNIINTYNEFVRSVWNALQRITDPIYRPIRRVLPDFGALDLSPLVVLLIIMVIQRILLPDLMVAYYGGMSA